MKPEETTITELVSTALSGYMERSPRSAQSAEGILGPSDIGFCRNKARLMTIGIAQTDITPKWAAAVGTAVHNYVEAALKKAHPDWLMGSIDDIRITATLPSGLAISGTPDIVIPADNMILDIKTVDGFEWIKREGTSQQHKYQRHLYALGLTQAGILDANKTVYVGNMYFDRSGKQQTPITLIDEMDYTLTDEIDSWIQDVVYAVTHNEEASKDIPAPVCEKICSHFTACRGSLETHEGGLLLDDKTLLSAVDMYVEARDLGKQADQMKKEAQTMLYGISGSTGKYQVRWVEVAPSTVNSFEKVGYSRMDIRKVRQ